jgi:hypothetical protein
MVNTAFAGISLFIKSLLALKSLQRGGCCCVSYKMPLTLTICACTFAYAFALHSQLQRLKGPFLFFTKMLGPFLLAMPL